MSTISGHRDLTMLWEFKGASQRWSGRCWLKEEREWAVTKGGVLEVESSEKKTRPNRSQWRQISQEVLPDMGSPSPRAQHLPLLQSSPECFLRWPS